MRRKHGWEHDLEKLPPVFRKDLTPGMMRKAAPVFEQTMLRQKASPENGATIHSI
jgi:hypothetical protein